MKVLALAILAFAISANGFSISCDPAKTDCKEPELQNEEYMTEFEEKFKSETKYM